MGTLDAGGVSDFSSLVIPAKAGIQLYLRSSARLPLALRASGSLSLLVQRK